MTKLRNYVRVFDDMFDAEKIADVYNAIMPIETQAVDIPGVTRYKFKVIAPFGDTFKDWRRLSYHFCSVLNEYKAALGSQHEQYWNEDVMENFTFRRYEADQGFQLPMFDSRSETTAPLFVSGIYFLNDAPDFQIEFDQSVAAHPIKAKAGRVVIFPSSWLFPYSFKTGATDVDIIKATMRWKEPR